MGKPYDLFTPEIYFYAGGGAASWGTLCGALIAAGSTINMVTPLSECMKVYNELIGWYTKEPFPSYALDAVAKIKAQPQSVSDSPLCHASISRWCEVSGFKMGSPERKDRCAKLTGDVAAQTVKLLNANSQRKLEAVFKVSEETAGCLKCHGATGEQGNVLSKMSCVQCHEPHDIK